MTLRFSTTGYRALPRPTGFEAWSDRLLGDGDALEREFRAMLSAPRPATGVGP